MNYLAHAFLSNNNDDLLIGNFIADHVNGNDFKNYSPDIIKGIYLHRAIDSFTDNHPKFKASKRLFYHGYERHSGILIDIYFDFFLASNFNKYSVVELSDFCKYTYATYTKHVAMMPKTSSNFLEYVLKNNIYYQYSSLESIEQVLYHFSHRINHKVMLNESILLFKKHESILEENFTYFFDDVLTQFL